MEKQKNPHAVEMGKIAASVNKKKGSKYWKELSSQGVAGQKKKLKSKTK